MWDSDRQNMLGYCAGVFGSSRDPLWRKPTAALASSLVGSALHLVLYTDAKTAVPRPPTSPHPSPHARRTGPQAQPRGRRPDLFRHLRTSVILEQGEDMLV